MEDSSPDRKNPFDPEPLTIALTLLGAIVPIGVLITQREIDPNQNILKREIIIRNSLYDADRALCDANQILKRFVSFLDSQGLIEKRFRVSEAPVRGDKFIINEFMELYTNSYLVGKSLNQAVVKLSAEIDQEDFDLCMDFHEELSESLEFAMQPEDYQIFANHLSHTIQISRRLVLGLVKRYRFRPERYPAR